MITDSEIQLFDVFLKPYEPTWQNANSSKILSFQGKTTRIPNWVYATVFMFKVGKHICFLCLLCCHLKFNGPDVGRAHLLIVKQEITEKFWLCKGTYWAVIIVKSVKVRQNTFCTWDIKINWFHFACNGLTITKIFANPRLEKRVHQTCVCFLKRGLE